MPSRKNKKSSLCSSGPSAIAGIPPADAPANPGKLENLPADETAGPPAGEPLPQSSAAQGTRTPRAKARKLRPPPRIRLGEAMRQKGLDERAIAEAYFKVVGTLTGRSGQGQEKVLVEVLDRCAKALEPVRPSEPAESNQPVIVQLIHDVPRPAYEYSTPAAKSPELKEQSQS